LYYIIEGKEEEGKQPTSTPRKIFLLSPVNSYQKEGKKTGPGFEDPPFLGQKKEGGAKTNWEKKISGEAQSQFLKHQALFSGAPPAISWGEIILPLKEVPPLYLLRGQYFPSWEATKGCLNYSAPNPRPPPLGPPPTAGKFKGPNPQTCPQKRKAKLPGRENPPPNS